LNLECEDYSSLSMAPEAPSCGSCRSINRSSSLMWGILHSPHDLQNVGFNIAINYGVCYGFDFEYLK